MVKQSKFRKFSDLRYQKWNTDLNFKVNGCLPFAPKYQAAAVIGKKMIIVGGESQNGLLDDVHVVYIFPFICLQLL